jgi:hypothetical protein
MSKREDEILAREISKFGGNLGGVVGSYLVAKHLPNNTLQLTLEIAAPARDVLETAFNILREQGKITNDAKTPSELPTITALVGAGFFNLNPALVSVQVAPISATLTKVSIHGKAKEGLIKQHAGEKAAKRIADMLNKTFSEPQNKT